MHRLCRPRGARGGLSSSRAALAARVHVRVEGKTQTIYGSTEPVARGRRQRARRARVGQPRRRVLLPRHGDVVRAVRRPDRPLSGRRVDRLGVQGQRRLAARRRRPVALHDGDTVLWYLATFGADRRAEDARAARSGAKRNCYRVVAQDDAGKATRGARARSPRRRPRRPHARRRRLRRQARRAREGDPPGRRALERPAVRRARLAARLCLALRLAGCASSQPVGRPRDALGHAATAAPTSLRTATRAARA